MPTPRQTRLARSGGPGFRPGALAAARCPALAASVTPHGQRALLALLRACAAGLSVVDSARHYLGTEHGHEAVTAHRQAVDAVRAVARRRGESAWRLVGLMIRATSGEPRPSLDAFVQQHGLDGFSESEALALYEEAHPLERKTARDQRLRGRQLALLRRLGTLAAETPQPSDRASGWSPPAVAALRMSKGHARADADGRLRRLHGVFAAHPAALDLARVRRS